MNPVRATRIFVRRMTFHHPFCFRATKSGYRIRWSRGLQFHMARIATAIIVTLRSGFYFVEHGIPDFYFGAVCGASRFICGSWNFYFTPILYACNTFSVRLLYLIRNCKYHAQMYCEYIFQQQGCLSFYRRDCFALLHKC